MQLSYIGSAYSLGYMISCMLFPTLIDIYGRKPFLTPYFTTMIMTSFLVLKAKTIGHMSALYFVYGFISSIRTSALISLLLESIPKKFKTVVSSINSLFGGIVLICNTFFIEHISNDYRKYHYVGICLTVLSMLALYWVPESPLYLHTKTNYKGARSSLRWIHKFNNMCNFRPTI